MVTARSLRNVRRNRIGGRLGRHSVFPRDTICTMSDDKSKTRPQDADRVNVHEDYEVQYLAREIWLHAGSIEGGREKGRCDGQGRRGGAETQVVSAKHAGAFEDIAYEPYSDRFDPADPAWRRGRLLLRRTRRRRWPGRFAAARPYRLALFWQAKLASAREF